MEEKVLGELTEIKNLLGSVQSVMLNLQKSVDELKSQLQVSASDINNKSSDMNPEIKEYTEVMTKLYQK